MTPGGAKFRAGGADGLQLEHVGRQVGHRGAGGFLLLGPQSTADVGQRGHELLHGATGLLRDAEHAGGPTGELRGLLGVTSVTYRTGTARLAITATALAG